MFIESSQVFLSLPMLTVLDLGSGTGNPGTTRSFPAICKKALLLPLYLIS